MLSSFISRLKDISELILDHTVMPKYGRLQVYLPFLSLYKTLYINELVDSVKVPQKKVFPIIFSDIYSNMIDSIITVMSLAVTPLS